MPTPTVVTSIPPTSIGSAAGDVATPGSNAAAVVTYAAVADSYHVVSGLAWSYSNTPTGGNLKIEDGSGTTVFSVDITTGGAGFLPFSPYKRGTTNTAMIVTLAAGGSGITGKLSVVNHWSEVG